MRVTALLFNPPGRGEYLTKHSDADDSNMPNSAYDIGQRSVSAMKHFWPTFNPGKVLSVHQEPSRWVAKGENWYVEWATDAYITEREAFVKRLMSGKATTEEVIARATEITNAKEFQHEHQ